MARQITKTNVALILLLIVFAIAASWPAAGQIQVGDNLNMNLNGVLSGGYSGTFGNLVNSSHGLNFGGNGVFSGFYHNPNFLSFSAAPYYGQSRQNGDFLSLFNSGGVEASTSIFGGSHFPGSISYSRSIDTQGNFSMPGLPNYTTRGNGQGFSVGWGAFLPDYPSLSATFSDGGGDHSVLGSPDNGSNNYKRLSLHSGYKLSGFNLSGFYNLGFSNASTPNVLGGTTTLEKTSGDDQSFGFAATHRLPLNGSASTSFSRSYVNSDFLGYRYNGTIDTLNASAGFSATPKLSFSVSSGYSDNLTGSLFQNVLPGTGQPVPGEAPTGGILSTSQSSNSFFVTGYSYYQLTKELQLQGDVQRRQQSYLGSSYASNLYGGGANYVRGLLGGFFSGSVNVVGSNSNFSNGNTLSFSTGVNYNRTFESWVTAVGFNYAQNVQAFLITYTNSFYNYSGSVRHRFFDRLVWTATGAGSRSAITNEPHTSNESQSYSSSIGLQHFSLNGSYGKSSGYGLLGATGLTQTGLPPGVIPPGWLIIYGGHSYSFGLGSTPRRRLSLGASFSRAWSDTSSAGTPSNNKVEQINAIMNYQLRKLTFTAGYGRLIQGFSAAGVPVSDLSSFSVGLSRSFNFF